MSSGAGSPDDVEGRDRRWAPDRELSVDGVREAVRSNFPSVDVSSVEHLGSGWEFDVYRTADDWVFRFPRRREYATQFVKDDAVHGLVRPLLEPDVRVPAIQLWGRPGPTFPYPFAGHRMVPGLPADRRTGARHHGLAAALGGAIGRIHSVPVEAAAAIGVVRVEEGCRDWLEEARGLASALSGVAGIVDVALEWLADAPPASRPDRAAARFIHDDLAPDHVLVDPESGALTGIIDWTDAGVGDPALDFVVLLGAFGWPFVESMLTAYPHDLDDGFATRLSYAARVLSLIWLYEAVLQGADVAKHVRWVEGAFSGPAPT